MKARIKIAETCMATDVQARVAKLGILDNRKRSPSSLSAITFDGSNSCGISLGDGSMLSDSISSTKKQKTLREMKNVDQCSPERGERINQLLMEFIAACALPFVIVQSIYFIKLLRALNSVYVDRHLPKAYTFTRTYLPKLHESVKLRVKELWKRDSNECRTLGSDGFTNETGGKVIIVTESLGPKVRASAWNSVLSALAAPGG